MIANKVGLFYDETLQDTISLLNHDTLQEAINRIEKKEHIAIVVSGAQKGIAYTFKEKMMKIGKKVDIFDSMDEAFMKHVIVPAIHYLFSSAILVKHQNVFLSVIN